jgi:hypothetical protein
VKRALAANLTGANAKTVFGVCKTVEGGGQVNILVAGEVADVSITGLSTGAGTSRLVVTDFENATGSLQCKLRHIDDSPAAGERFVVGSSDEAGTLVIQPRHSSDETGFQKVYNLKAYGALENWDGVKPTNDGTANLAAFKRALAAMQADGNVGAKLVADGRFYFSDTLVLNQTIVFEGTSMNEPTAIGGSVVPDPDNPNALRRSSPGTWLIFPPMNAGKRVTGIRLHGGSLNNKGSPREVDAVPNLGASAADKTILRNLTIHCYLERGLEDMVPQGADETSPRWNPLAGQSHGVHASTTFYAENVTVQFFAGDGFHVMGYYDNPNGPVDKDDYFGGNVDDSRLRNCVVGSCGRDGFHVYGTDASACLFDSCVAQGNRRYGFFDGTRENTYINCHAEGNGPLALGPKYPPADRATGSEYHTESGTSTLIGCYAEGGKPGEGNQGGFYGLANIVGGTIGMNYVSEDSTAFVLETGVASRAPFQYINHRTYVPKGIIVTLGGNSDRGAAPGQSLAMDALSLQTIAFNADGTHHGEGHLPGGADDEIPDDTIVLRYTYAAPPAVPTDAQNWWVFENNDSYYRQMLRLPTSQANARLPAPWFPNGIFLGRDDDRLTEELPDRPPKVAFTAAAAPPKAQYDGANSPITYERGDVVWNSRPELGGPLGQVCITSGTWATAPLSGMQTAETVTVNPDDVTTVKINILDRLVRGQHITIGGTTNYRVVKITLPTIDISPNALPGADPGTFLSAGTALSDPATGEPLVGVVTTACVKVGDPTLELNEVKGLVPGQKIEVARPDGKPPDIYEIVKVTLPTIDIKTPPAPPGPPAVTIIANGTTIAFRPAEFAQFGRVEVIGTTVVSANHEARAGERLVVRTAGTIVTIPASPVDGDTVEVLNMSGGNVTVDAGANTIYAAGGSTLRFGNDVKKTFTWIGNTVDEWKAS